LLSLTCFHFQMRRRGISARCTAFASLRTASCTPAARKTALCACGKRQSAKRTACGSAWTQSSPRSWKARTPFPRFRRYPPTSRTTRVVIASQSRRNRVAIASQSRRIRFNLKPSKAFEVNERLPTRLGHCDILKLFIKVTERRAIWSSEHLPRWSRHSGPNPTD